MKKHKDAPSISQLLDLLSQSQENNKHLIEEIQRLRQQVEKLQRMIFGQSSERKASSKNKPAKSDAGSKASPKDKNDPQNKKGNGRKKLPADLPRKVVKHDIPEDERSCPRCKNNLQCVGKDVSEQLEFIPSKLCVIEHRRYKYACRCCQSIISAPMPEQPIDKGLAGPGLLAETLIAKYEDHLPLYRQEKRYERLGYSIARSTLCDWIMACADRLSPIVKSMHEDMLLRSPKIHSDDTIIPVLEKGKTRNGRLWVYLGGGGHAPPCVVFRYSKTRSGKEPKSFLGSYRGYLQADAYAGYDKCYESGDILEVACFAHARRKFVDALKVCESDVVAQEAIERIAELYGIEKRAKRMTDRERYYYRKRFAKPKLKSLYKWLNEHKGTAPPKSPIGKAISYSLNHWEALKNYLRDGVLAIDNNIAERAIRSVVLGRKNYLFAGSDQGATSAATIYSLIETCKLLNINSFDYLTDVLKRLPTTLNSDLKTLLPYNWKPIEG